MTATRREEALTLLFLALAVSFIDFILGSIA